MFKNLLHLYNSSSAVLGLTYRCQCECVHCSAGLYAKNVKKELNTEEWLAILDSVSSLGVPRINISGGEALLREDIFEIIKYAAKKFVVILESNGQLLTEDNVKRLKRARLSCIAVSVDSYDPSMHDALRNLNSCFKNAIEGISNAVRHKIPCLLSTYVCSERVDRENIIGMMSLAKQLKVLAVRVLPSRPVGKFASQTASLLTKEQEEKLLEYVDPKLAYFKGIPAPKQCGVFCKAVFYISPYGEIQPCSYLPIFFGNIKESALKNLLERMWGSKIFSMEKKDCLILNKEFRQRYIDPFINNRNYSFPLKIL